MPYSVYCLYTWLFQGHAMYMEVGFLTSNWFLIGHSQIVIFKKWQVVEASSDQLFSSVCWENEKRLILWYNIF